jgi:hypothetical protein
MVDYTQSPQAKVLCDNIRPGHFVVWGSAAIFVPSKIPQSEQSVVFGIQIKNEIREAQLLAYTMLGLKWIYLKLL